LRQSLNPFTLQTGWGGPSKPSHKRLRRSLNPFTLQTGWSGPSKLQPERCSGSG